MRVNVYAEEMTERIEIIEKVIDGLDDHYDGSVNATNRDDGG